jgi:putative oxygen-independent coproporphyrinogen III oxidase
VLSFGPRPPVALYVHVPFCGALCPYCDFVALVGAAGRGSTQRLAIYLEAVHLELDLRADALAARFGAERPPLRSLYLGGGTPSLLPAAEVARLVEHVRSRFGLAADAEVTLEANPGPAERGDLAGFVAAGVNRLSLGVQSLEPQELRRLGRRHGPADVAEAVAAARRAGLTNVSVDLLYDVPGQTLTSWERTLGEVLRLGVEHVSAYALTLDDPAAEGLTGPLGDHLPPRPGARSWRERARAEQDEERAAACYERADQLLSAAGLAWYELSNWARPGFESRHNLAYWRRQPYEAVGPGAHAHDGGATRRWNAARLNGYLEALVPATGCAPRLPPGGEETLGLATQVGEAAMLGLRLCEGIGPQLAAAPGVAPAVEWGMAEGLLQGSPEGRLRLTNRGRLLADEVFVRLSMAG